MRKKLRLFILMLAVVTAGCFPQTKKIETKTEPLVRVLLATLAENDSLFFHDLYVLRSEEAHYEFGERNQQLNIVPLKSGIQLYNQNRNLLYRNYFPIRLEPATPAGHFVFRGREYSGTIIFAPAADAVLYLVNELPLEEYLKGVLPAEINTIRSPYFEAMKAQAICSRTYALKRMQAGENQNRPYDLESTIVDQVYAGFDRHTELADRAVAETRGICVTYQGDLADIFYHSTCGGWLEPANQIWPSIKAPYLNGGIDAVSDTFSCSSSPFFRWRETRTLAQLDSSFYSNYGQSLLQSRQMEQPADTLYLQFDLRVKQRSSSGRIERSYSSASGNCR